MKAVRLLEYGGQLVFNDVPTPTLARDEILVKTRSTAVNHLDLVEASGTARQILPIDLPWIPGHEFSGVVGYLVSATGPVSQEEAAVHHVSGVMMRLAPTGEGLGRIGRLLEEGTIRPDVATVYALEDVAQAWKDIARNLPGGHGISTSGPGTARPKSHGKIVLRVA
jgi:NADPH:quinone reductase-like Zn-dependent oxidoreductase